MATANKIFVNGETPFQVTKRAFSVGESATGYTLYTSVDCKSADDEEAHFKPYSDVAIAADAQLDIADTTAGRWWKLVGNVGTVCVRF